MKDLLDHLRWLQQQNVAASAFASIPDAKVKQFAAEARSLDLASLNDMPERKRLTLVAALILKQVARSLDDAAEMFIRQVQKMHNKAGDALVLYRGRTQNEPMLLSRGYGKSRSPIKRRARGNNAWLP